MTASESADGPGSPCRGGCGCALGLTNGLHGTRRSHRPWGTDETSELVRMYERGDSVSDISMKLGRSERSIKGKVYNLGLSRPSIE